MKIPRSVRNIYDEQYDINVKIKELVDKKLESLRQPRWHYESRIKSLESFALKLETGRFESSKGLEDFFACTIVVENKSALKLAEDLIRTDFTLKERRPSYSQ